MTTYLSKLHDREKAHTTREQAARRSGLDEPTVQTILSELTTSGVLQAKVEVRCPHCNSQHDIYSRRGNIPEESQRCISCQRDLQVDRQSNWEVIYEIKEEPGDFFRETGARLSYYADECHNLPASFFEAELEHFKARDDPKKRGRDFDVLMGLLFQQLPDVNVRLKGSSDTGEVDVYIDCIHAPDWICRLMGTHTMVENKWENSPIGTKEVSAFREKTTDIDASNVSYIASMSGFTTGQRKQIGATAKIRGYENPRMIDLWDDDIVEMMSAGTPKPVLEERRL